MIKDLLKKVQNKYGDRHLNEEEIRSELSVLVERGLIDRKVLSKSFKPMSCRDFVKIIRKYRESFVLSGNEASREDETPYTKFLENKPCDFNSSISNIEKSFEESVENIRKNSQALLQDDMGNSSVYYTVHENQEKPDLVRSQCNYYNRLDTSKELIEMIDKKSRDIRRIEEALRKFAILRKSRQNAKKSDILKRRGLFIFTAAVNIIIFCFFIIHIYEEFILEAPY